MYQLKSPHCNNRNQRFCVEHLNSLLLGYFDPANITFDNNKQIIFRWPNRCFGYNKMSKHNIEGGVAVQIACAFYQHVVSIMFYYEKQVIFGWPNRCFGLNNMSKHNIEGGVVAI